MLSRRKKLNYCVECIKYCSVLNVQCYSCLYTITLAIQKWWLKGFRLHVTFKSVLEKESFGFGLLNTWSKAMRALLKDQAWGKMKCKKTTTKKPPKIWKEEEKKKRRIKIRISPPLWNKMWLYHDGSKLTVGLLTHRQPPWKILLSQMHIWICPQIIITSVKHLKISPSDYTEPMFL